MPEQGTIVVLCGSRTAPPFSRAHLDWLTAYRRTLRICEVVEGGAAGLDQWARAWAQQSGINVVTFWANWTQYGKAAGPLRNTRMVDYLLRKQRAEGYASAVLAFPGGAGTANLCRQARTALIPVYTYAEVSHG